MLRQFNMLLILFIVRFQTAAFRCSHCCHNRHHRHHRHHHQRKLIVLSHTRGTYMCAYNIHMTQIYMSFFSNLVCTVLTNVDFYMKIAFKSLYLSRWQFPFYVHLLNVSVCFASSILKTWKCAQKEIALHNNKGVQKQQLQKRIENFTLYFHFISIANRAVCFVKCVWARACIYNNIHTYSIHIILAKTTMVCMAILTQLNRIKKKSHAENCHLESVYQIYI